MFDLADYAHKVANETGDAEFAAIATDIDAAFSNAFVRYEDVNWNTEQFLPHYTLSVCLFDHETYHIDIMNRFKGLNPICNINDGYEQTTFHQMTGWGKWLDTNQKNPRGNPTSGGKLLTRGQRACLLPLHPGIRVGSSVKVV